MQYGSVRYGIVLTCTVCTVCTTCTVYVQFLKIVRYVHVYLCTTKYIQYTEILTNIVSFWTSTESFQKGCVALQEKSACGKPDQRHTGLGATNLYKKGISILREFVLNTRHPGRRRE